MKFGLIGNPIEHSLSPALFKAAYGEGYEHTYELLKAEDIATAIEKVCSGGYSGINITTPFKEEAMRYVTENNRAVALLGATNLLLIKDTKASQNKQIAAYNTDYQGVREIATREAALSCGSLKKAVVIGLGGAGRAAALALKDSGYETIVCNRSTDKAALFADKIGVKYASLEKIPSLVSEKVFIVYALSVKIEQLVTKTLPKGSVLLEANYKKPSFLGEEKANSNYKYIKGIEWLLAQAIPSFELFTGQTPNIRAMREFADLIK